LLYFLAAFPSFKYFQRAISGVGVGNDVDPSRVLLLTSEDFVPALLEALDRTFEKQLDKERGIRKNKAWSNDTR
jgi:hypothetical protein